MCKLTKIGLDAMFEFRCLHYVIRSGMFPRRLDMPLVLY